MARKALGKEKRVTRSIRIEPAKRNAIEKRFGSLQTWFDIMLDAELRGEVKTPTPLKVKRRLSDKISKIVDEIF